MKRWTRAGQTSRETGDTPSHDSSAGEGAIALAPPDYGLDFVDRGIAVATTSSPIVQLHGDPEEEQLLQGKFAPVQRTGPESEPTPHANNTGLPDNLKSGIESLSGVCMDNVKVHYNSSRPAQLKALAYAQGSDIHVAPRQEQHLPHEAWHVVQQTQGRVQPTMQMKDGVQVNDDEGLEYEANVMGAKVSLAIPAQSQTTPDGSFGPTLRKSPGQGASRMKKSLSASTRPDVAYVSYSEIEPRPRTPENVLQLHPNIERTPEEITKLVSDTIRAIAQNEIGGKKKAIPSRMHTSAKVSASYASATQMIPSHAVSVMLGRKLPQETKDRAQAIGTEHDLSPADLRNADKIMIAAQNIWTDVVVNRKSRTELDQAEMTLTGFTPNEMTRIYHFKDVRKLLLDNKTRYHEIKTALETYLESKAVSIDAEVSSLLTRSSAEALDRSPLTPAEDIATPSVATPVAKESVLGELAVKKLSSSQSSKVKVLLSFELPSTWATMTTAKKRSWLIKKQTAVKKARGKIAEILLKGAEAYLAHELAGNEHVTAVGLDESDLEAYIHEGKFDRFGEDTAGWTRIALSHTSHGKPGSIGNLDSAIAVAAEAGDGWTLSKFDFDTWIRDWISKNPNSTDEQVVRAAAAHNGKSKEYPDRIWRFYEQLRKADEGAAAPAATTPATTTPSKGTK